MVFVVYCRGIFQRISIISGQMCLTDALVTICTWEAGTIPEFQLRLADL